MRFESNYGTCNIISFLVYASTWQLTKVRLSPFTIRLLSFFRHIIVLCNELTWNDCVKSWCNYVLCWTEVCSFQKVVVCMSPFFLVLPLSSHTAPSLLPLHLHSAILCQWEDAVPSFVRVRRGFDFLLLTISMSVAHASLSPLMGQDPIFTGSKVPTLLH